MRLGERSEQLRERLLIGLVGVLLVAQEDDAVGEQRLTDLMYDLGRQVAADAYPVDFGADVRRHLRDVDVLVGPRPVRGDGGHEFS